MTTVDETLNEKWESGELGSDAKHVRRAAPEVEAAVDQALAMKLVTIRLPIPLIEMLKRIAEYHGIGYQPMVRDLLGRFAASEIRTILSDLAKKADEDPPEKTAPVDSFLQEQRRVACG